VILVENRDFFMPHLHLKQPPLGGPHFRNVVVTFGTEKPEWCGYRTVKKVWGYD